MTKEYEPTIHFFGDYHDIESADGFLRQAKLGYRCIEIGFDAPNYVGLVYKSSLYHKQRKLIEEYKKMFTAQEEEMDARTSWHPLSYITKPIFPRRPTFQKRP